jgi:hypothetical protein
MSVRSEKNTTAQLSPTEAMAAAITEAQPADSHLAESATYTTNTPENALHRTIVVSVRASLNELCLQKQKGTWAPSQEALRSIMQARKYTSLDGSAEQQGDLKVRDSTYLVDRARFPHSTVSDARVCSLLRSRLCSTTSRSRTSSRPSRCRSVRAGRAEF